MTHTLTHGGGGLTPDEKLLQKQRVKAIKSSLANHHTLSKPSSAAPNKPPAAPLDVSRLQVWVLGVRVQGFGFWV